MFVAKNKLACCAGNLLFIAVVVLCSLSFGCSSLLNTENVQTGSRKQTEASVPSPRVAEYEWMSKATWFHMHADDVAAAQEGGADLIFLGDSITESWTWEGGYKEVFEEYFGEFKSANFGIGGDQTQNLLWRLQNGLTGRLNPSAVVVMIGVNNFGHGDHAPEQVFAGVETILEQTKINYPRAKILLCGIFPFDENPTSPNRRKVRDTNAMLATLGDGEVVFYRDFGGIFLNPEGVIPQALMGDFLHPSVEGMRLFAEQVKPVVADLLRAPTQ